MNRQYDFVLFDLLTALLDSWSLWNRAAGSESAGRAWRAAYLQRTYACGAYRPYETLVLEAAQEVGLGAVVAQRLEDSWNNLQPWSGVNETLQELKRTHRLGVVTNCSERLGHLAVQRLSVTIDVVVTSERAGFYKPNPKPYQMALDELGARPSNTLFVAGSGFDLFGTEAVGIDTFWHNRVGLDRPDGAPPAMLESDSLAPLIQLANNKGLQK